MRFAIWLGGLFLGALGVLLGVTFTALALFIGAQHGRLPESAMQSISGQFTGIAIATFIAGFGFLSQIRGRYPTV